MDKTTVSDPKQLIPNHSSKTEEWIAFYNSLVNWFGKDAARIAFARAWTKFDGGNGKADIVVIQNATELKLDKTLLQTASANMDFTANIFSGFLETASTGGKILFYSSIGLGVLIVLGLTYKVVTLSSEDTGKIIGVAAKTFV